MEYHGTLVAFDGYMNLQLADTQEWVNGTCRGQIGETLIRCNNVLYVRDKASCPPEQPSDEPAALESAEPQIESMAQN